MIQTWMLSGMLGFDPKGLGCCDFPTIGSMLGRNRCSTRYALRSDGNRYCRDRLKRLGVGSGKSPVSEKPLIRRAFARHRRDEPIRFDYANCQRFGISPVSTPQGEKGVGSDRDFSGFRFILE